jgi:hypothetical protein
MQRRRQAGGTQCAWRSTRRRCDSDTCLSCWSEYCWLLSSRGTSSLKGTLSLRLLSLLYRCPGCLLQHAGQPLVSRHLQHQALERWMAGPAAAPAASGSAQSVAPAAALLYLHLHLPEGRPPPLGPRLWDPLSAAPATGPGSWTLVMSSAMQRSTGCCCCCCCCWRSSASFCQGPLRGCQGRAWCWAPGCAAESWMPGHQLARWPQRSPAPPPVVWREGICGQWLGYCLSIPSRTLAVRGSAQTCTLCTVGLHRSAHWHAMHR